MRKYKRKKERERHREKERKWNWPGVQTIQLMFLCVYIIYAMWS